MAAPPPRPSPNIWHHPEVYELENRAFDPDGLVEEAIREIADWSGRDLLDIGCGSGFHLPRFADAARSVTGVEPYAPLVTLARRRTTRSASKVQVLQGAAEALPVPPSSVDVAHARWAYFFGPGCEPGLRELHRVMRRGGTALVVDNDGTRSTFGGWFRRAFPTVDAAKVERFWSAQGWSRSRILTEWRFDDRESLEAVVAIELDPRTARDVLAEHQGCTVDYAVNLWWRRY